MVKHVEHFFTYLLAICACSIENCLLSSFAHLSIELLILCMSSFLGVCVFWLLIPFQMCSWQRFFSHCVALFSLVTVFFAKEERTPMLLKLFHEVQKERMLPNSF
jgi:hypothetical protein